MKSIIYKIKNYCLKLLKSLCYNFSFIISSFSLLHLLIFNNFKKKIVFLFPEGGFAHTLLTPEVLRRLYEGKNWCIIYAYQQDRHNFLTKEIYPKNFFWLRLTISFFNKTLVKEEFKFKIFSILENYLKKNNIEYYYFGDFIHKYNNFNSLQINPLYSKEGLPMNEYNSFRILDKKNEHNLPHQSSKKVKDILINLGKKKICGFAYKEHKQFKLNGNVTLPNTLNNYSYTGNISTYVTDNIENKIIKNSLEDEFRNYRFKNERATDNLENYKKSFFNVINKGWDIYLYGDPIFKAPKWFDEIKKNIHYSRNYSGKDQFNFKAGVISDCFIGPSSGASSWKYVFPSRPQLIIDSYPIGYIYYNSIIAYKFIEYHPQNKKINQIINDKIYFFNQPPFKYRFSTEEEKNEIIMDFIDNLDNLENISMKHSDLNLNPDHPIIWSKTYISKKWYELQEKFL